MKTPEIVVECLKAMKAAVSVPVTVKCRLGVDEEDSYEFIHGFVKLLSKEANITHFVIHARKAFLKGLNPKENRMVPPLIYDRVYQLSNDFPHLNFSINGGIKSIEAAADLLKCGKLYGAMVGRYIYEDIWHVSKVDRMIYKQTPNNFNREEVFRIYAKYCEYAITKNPDLSPVTLMKPINSIMTGQRGATMFRQYISNRKNYEKSGSFILYFDELVEEIRAVNEGALKDRPF